MDCQRLHGDLQVRGLGGADYGNVDVGIARNPRHSDVRSRHAPALGDFPHAARDLVIDSIAVEILERIVRRSSSAGTFARNEPTSKWTERRQSDSLILAIGDHLALFLAV